MDDLRHDCFCGCGRSAAYGQARAVSVAARRVAVRLERVAAGDPRRDEGERLLRQARAVLHDDAPTPARLAAALEAWCRHDQPHPLEG